MSGQRVAPTQKISDDASYAPRTAQGSGAPVTPFTVPGVVSPRPLTSTPHPAIAAVPQSAPLRTPPRSQPISTPPPQLITGPRPTQRPPVTGGPARAQAPIDDPSLSLPTEARRPWGLIFVVLVIDLALAGTGSWLLSQGIGGASNAAKPAPSPPAHAVEVTPIEPRAAGSAGSSPTAASSPPTAASSPPTAASSPPSAAAAHPAGAGSAKSLAGSAVPVAAGTPDAGAKPLDAGVAPKPKRPHPPAAASGKGPVDPYDTHAPDPLPTETK